MSSDTWRTSARVAFVLALLFIVAALAPFASCSWEALDTLGADAPAGLFARLQLVAPTCLEAHPVSDALPFGLLSLLTLIFGVFARNQSQLVEGSAVTVSEEDLDRALRRKEQLDSGREEGSAPVPTAIPIDLDEELDLGRNADLSTADEERYADADEESLMAYVEAHRAASEAEEDAEPAPAAGSTTVDGFFCPPGFEGKPVIYVDPASEAASDHWSADTPNTDPLDNPERPFRTLEAAVAMASRRVVSGAPAIQIRLLPGVYQTSVQLPDRVVLVNHRLPAEGTARQRLQWLMDQGLDHPDNVTLFPPAGAPFAVRIAAGRMQGIFGCHLAGRDGVAQAGVLVENALSAAIVHCQIEGFSRGGVVIRNGGGELPNQQIIVSSCRIRRNSARRGGAVLAEKSSLRIEGSILQDNRARSGGAICVTDMKLPVVVRTTRIAANQAMIDAASDLDVDAIELTQWQRADGLGGGMYAATSKLKLQEVEFVDNQASIAGGGLALLGSQAILQPADHPCAFRRNRAGIGAGAAVVGWHGAEATLKGADLGFEENHARRSGGALALIGSSAAQLQAPRIIANEVSGISGHDGLGGGVSLHLGAEIILQGGEVARNRCAGDGGGIGAVNGRLRLAGDVAVVENLARVSGGGVYAVTQPSPQIERLVANHGFRLPFVVAFDEARIERNASTEAGGGARLGNLIDQPTMPLGLRFERTARLRSNRTKARDTRAADLWIFWAGRLQNDDGEAPESKLLLK